MGRESEETELVCFDAVEASLDVADEMVVSFDLESFYLDVLVTWSLTSFFISVVMSLTF